MATPAPTRPERVLLVHAHPDDETLASGGTIATLLELGAEVTVLTATRGERGEMLTPELAPLFGDAPRVAEHRETRSPQPSRHSAVRGTCGSGVPAPARPTSPSGPTPTPA